MCDFVMLDHETVMHVLPVWRDPDCRQRAENLSGIPYLRKDGKLMTGFSVDIEKSTEQNGAFRKVLFTGPNSQLVVMTLQVGEDIGQERHDSVDQFIRIEKGKAVAILDGERHELEEDWAIVIPAGTLHNVINSSDDEPLRLYTVYSPPNHPDGTVHQTRAEAETYELAHHG